MINHSSSSSHQWHQSPAPSGLSHTSRASPSRSVAPQPLAPGCPSTVSPPWVSLPCKAASILTLSAPRLLPSFTPSPPFPPSFLLPSFVPPFFTMIDHNIYPHHVDMVSAFCSHQALRGTSHASESRPKPYSATMLLSTSFPHGLGWNRLQHELRPACFMSPCSASPRASRAPGTQLRCQQGRASSPTYGQRHRHRRNRATRPLRVRVHEGRIRNTPIRCHGPGALQRHWLSIHIPLCHQAKAGYADDCNQPAADAC